jgi:ubiquinone/menaquinone biosynthesis C-methylase UbiE
MAEHLRGVQIMSGIFTEEVRRDKGFLYSWTPMLIFDRQGVVIDCNYAFYELLGPLGASCKGITYRELESRLAASFQGSLIPSSGAIARRACQAPLRSIAVQDIAVACSELSVGVEGGRVALKAFETPCFDLHSGHEIGSLISVEFLGIGDRQRFNAALERRFRHELMWEIYASSYDQVLPRLPFYQEVLRRHLAAMDVPWIASVLDIGAGTGSVTIPLLEAGKQVCAVDTTHAMVTRLTHKARNRFPNQLRVIEDTAQRIPQLPDGSFQGVTAMLSYFDMEDPRASLEESIRLLAPGGTIVVTEPKTCFDVQALMAYSQKFLVENGLVESLGEAWGRIQAIAPLINQRIDRHADGAMQGTRERWSAEEAHRSLERLRFQWLTFQDSHLGNCATIIGQKPVWPKPF